MICQGELAHVLDDRKVLAELFCIVQSDSFLKFQYLRLFIRQKLANEQ
jgi:hypothetical protein